jgi:hypothetical protein
MKKIKVLRAVVGIFLAQCVIAILGSVCLMIKMAPYKHVDGIAYMGSVALIIQIIKNTLPLPGLVLLFQALHYFIKWGYFNHKSAVKLRLSGILLAVFSIVEFIATRLTWKYMKYSFIEDTKGQLVWLEGFTTLCVYLIIGFGLYTLSDFIRRGEAIENENKLTI